MKDDYSYPPYKEYKPYTEVEGTKQKTFIDIVKDKLCLHSQCPKCKGTGTNQSTGQICIHNLACPCRKCRIS